MWKVVLRKSQVVLADGFKSLADADKWHDMWIDNHYPSGDHPAVDFVPY